MHNEIIEFLKNKDVEHCVHASLATLSSIKAGGSAYVIASPDSIEKMVEILKFLVECSMEFRVVGNMTNTMSFDREYPGIIIRTNKINRKTWAENECIAECGARLSDVLWEGAKANLGGAEELFMIPALIGGAVYNNAGAHGVNIADVFVSGYFFCLDTRTIVEMNRSDMHFGYRYSILHERDFILLSATFRLLPSSFPNVKAKIAEYAAMRRVNQPLEHPSLGSVFKKCSKTGAGYYIEKAGLKGHRIGGAEVSCKHAGFIINRSNASATDVIELIAFVKATVYRKFGVMLEEEIEFI